MLCFLAVLHKDDTSREKLIARECMRILAQNSGCVSPDEGDKPAVELGIFTAAQEKDMLNKGQLKKKVRDSKALYFNSKNIKVLFNGLELIFKPMKKKTALINLY